MGMDFFVVCRKCRVADDFPGTAFVRASVFVYQHADHSFPEVMSEYEAEREGFWYWDADEEEWFGGEGEAPQCPDPEESDLAFIDWEGKPEPRKPLEFR